ncbi:MAG: hypothetical protein JKY53_09775 [Flavobacteriales bacterium]|nr:hypothetical protein [Flavobacteriales bacterium]
MEKLNVEIQELIDYKDFQDLLLTEKEMVLKAISKQEYDLYRNIILNIPSIMDEEAHFLSPDPSIKSKLNDALNKEATSSSITLILDKLFNFSVPSYQVVISLATIVLAFVWFGNSNNQEIIVQEKIVYQSQVDTVYIETQVEVSVVEIRTVERVVEVPINNISKNASLIGINSFTAQKEKAKEEENRYAFSESQLSENQRKSMGNTSLTKETLNQFLVVIN